MISAGKGTWRGTVFALLGGCALVAIGLGSASVARATVQVPPVPGDGTNTATTVSPLQPGGPPPLAPESDSVGVGAPAPLRISSGDDGGQPRPPLWVGAVVGASGVAGLALSAALHRRRVAAGGPDEPDLAQAV
jgi:hypothetical protein